MIRKIKILFIGLIGFQALCAQNNNFIRKDNEDTEAPETFTVPEAFNSALDSLVYSYYATHSKKGKCRRPFDENIDYPDSVIKKRLSSLPYEIAMPYNEAVKGFIDFYAGRKRRQVENMLGLGKYYFPMFEDVLDKYKIPLELKYLPVIESALNTGAVSPVGAAGLWQFMPSTGKMYGLQVNTLVDERRDPLKASVAAARFLRDLYNIYGDWHLAIAAYNCGPGNVNKAIRRSGGKRDFWQIYPYLPRETRSYVPIFIAANYVMNYYSNHNLCPAEFNMPVHTDTVRVNHRISFSDVSSVLKISVDELRILNPQYRRDIIPGNSGNYSLRLPNHIATQFIALQDSIYKRSKTIVATDSTEVKSESKADTDEEEEEAPKNVRSKKKKKEKSHHRTTHKVRKGDNLTEIANRYGVTVSDIKKWNGLRKNKIMVGERLIIKR